MFCGHADVDDATLGALAHGHCAEGAFDGEVVADHGGHESFRGHVFLCLLDPVLPAGCVPVLPARAGYATVAHHEEGEHEGDELTWGV